MITSDYGFLLRLVNTFPIDTDEYCPISKYDAKSFKTLYIILRFALTNNHMYCTGAFKIILI